MYNMTINTVGFSDELPVFDYRESILSAVDTNQVTIITAETGAGKSTQVPQYLADHGYRKVIVTQPRILAARNLSRRVREEWALRTGKDSDALIGYRTAHERDDGPDTTILYCTDGLQLVREITGSGTSERQVLVLDEVHEWNENMEVLVAWAKKRCQEQPRFKVVIMSATIEVDELAAYFDGAVTISVPGRSFDVEKRFGKDVVTEIVQQIEMRRSNMLVFLPGKAEIESVAMMIKTKAAAADVPIIPLHSQLEASAQQLAFASYPNGKVILATNIAQTSVTIDDIDVVIDSGLARQSEVRSGVEGLFITQVSQADCLQRAGRAGRTKAGEYILAPLDDMPCLPFDDREEYATPEILRKHIDRLTLRLANVGIDIEMLDFYHDPSRRAIRSAKHTLVSLGAMTAQGEVTNIGRQMEKFPVESSYARMLVEASEQPKSLQVKLAAIIGIQEIGGIVKGGTRYTGWRKYTRQTRSDLVAQYDVYLALPDIDPEEYEELGIISKNVAKADEVMERLHRDLGLQGIELTAVEESELDSLLRCIVAGQINQLWVVEADGTALHVMTKKKRELSSSSVVTNAKLVAGTPFDLQIQTQKGDLETLHLVQGITAVKPRWLELLAPDMFKARQGKTFFDSRRGRLATRQLVRFNGRTLEGESAPLGQLTSRDKRLFSELYSAWVYEQLEAARRRLQHNYKRRIPAVPLRQIQQRVRAILQGATSLDELHPSQRAEIEKLSQLQTYLGEVFVAKLETSRRRSPHSDDRSSSRSWRAPHKRKYDRRRGR